LQDLNVLAVPGTAVNDLTTPDDPRLAALRSAAGGAAWDEELSRLLLDLVPVINGILARASGANVLMRENADDLRADVLTRLFHKLRGGEAVARIDDYIATVTRNCIHDFLRACRPERTRLGYRIRFLLTNDDRFATWSVDGSTRCGLAAWRDSRAIAEATLPMPAPGEVFDASRPANALLALFAAIDGPLELDGLVTWLMDLWNVPEERSIDIESVSLPDERPTQLAHLESRLFMEALWSEVSVLPPLQRAALLLNLRDRDRGNALTLFVLLGIADIDALAVAIGLPAEELAQLWCRLPLDDAAIAARLGVTRQQVINLRKSARERLRRRLRT
jgi:RNA polymerase sigma factor (sigma-70 family)